MGFTVFSGYFEKVMSQVQHHLSLAHSPLARSSSTVQWVCTFSSSPIHDQCLLLRSITPSITSLACTRVFLALRGYYLHSGTNNPPSRTHNTFPSSHDPDDVRNLSLDFFASGRSGTTARSTSAGAYEVTTFENTTVGMELGSIAESWGAPQYLDPRQQQTAYGGSASNCDQKHLTLATECHSLPKTAFPNKGIINQRELEEGRGEDGQL